MKRFSSESKECSVKVKRTNDEPCNFEKISTNVDIMLHIYKLIDFKDQIQLCLASETLKYIFQTFVWKKNYRTLAIIGFASNYVVTNETSTDQVCLTYKEYQIFLRIYAGSVQKLISSYDAVPDLRLFHNLTKLEYKFAKAFTKEHLRLVAQNCPQLEELQLKYCGNRYLNHIDFEDALDVNLLLKMSKLNRLLVVDRYPDKIKYSHFHDIITKTRLEYLKMNACIEPDASVAKSDAVSSLRGLQIEAPFNSSRWPSNYSSFLTNFDKLTSLILSINDLVNEEILKAIKHTCVELETLTICSTIFQHIESFSIPSRLTDLSLVACEGLTYDNLKQLLTSFTIKKFTSQKTHYQGVFKDFQISPHIEVLDLDGAYTHNFSSAFRDNSILKQLTWYDMKDCTAGSHMLRRIPIETCVHLESLTIKSGFMPLAPIMHLKSLQKFAMPHSMPFLNWRYILILLKHPSLVEIDIGDGSPPQWLTKATHIPAKGFVTNVKRLTISLRVFLSALKFWLDLFSCNPQMKLTCKKFPMNEKIIRHIIMHERFPRSLRKIDISGFTISCQDLRIHFGTTMEKFLNDSNYMKIISKNLHRITLCRSS